MKTLHKIEVRNVRGQVNTMYTYGEVLGAHWLHHGNIAINIEDLNPRARPHILSHIPSGYPKAIDPVTRVKALAVIKVLATVVDDSIAMDSAACAKVKAYFNGNACYGMRELADTATANKAVKKSKLDKIITTSAWRGCAVDDCVARVPTKIDKRTFECSEYKDLPCWKLTKGSAVAYVPKDY